eukprot:1903387-Alexandrium_andersonii.AAC.1
MDRGPDPPTLAWHSAQARVCPGPEDASAHPGPAHHRRWRSLASSGSPPPEWAGKAHACLRT